MELTNKIAILILAAGKSSRMGNHIKQLLPWKNTTLLCNAINQAEASSAAETFVVLGAYQKEINPTLNSNSRVIHNPNWKEGLGSSIASGMNYFRTQKLNFDAVLILLADQPLIDTDYINNIIREWQRNTSKIITTAYKSRSGVPALFANSHFDELRKLNKDFGAKDIIASHENVILALSPEGKEIDIDDWETYQQLLKSKN